MSLKGMPRDAHFVTDDQLEICIPSPKTSILDQKCKSKDILTLRRRSCQTLTESRIMPIQGLLLPRLRSSAIMHFKRKVT